MNTAPKQLLRLSFAESLSIGLYTEYSLEAASLLFGTSESTLENLVEDGALGCMDGPEGIAFLGFQLIDCLLQYFDPVSGQIEADFLSVQLPTTSLLGLASVQIITGLSPMELHHMELAGHFPHQVCVEEQRGWEVASVEQWLLETKYLENGIEAADAGKFSSPEQIQAIKAKFRP